MLNDDATRALTASRTTSNTNSGELVRQLMATMISEAERCIQEGVVKSPDDVDYALLSGAGFPVFRGGLLRYAHRGKSEQNVAAPDFDGAALVHSTTAGTKL